MAFQKGQSGNPGGKNQKPFEAALRLEIAAAPDQKALRDVARMLIASAKAGKPWAIAMLAERLDGKALQQIESHNINEYVFAEVPKTDTTDEWMKSPGAAVGASSPAPKPN